MLLGALALSGCGGSDAPAGTGTTSTGAAAPAAGSRPVRVVHSILPMALDGDDSKDMVAAMRLAIDEQGADQGAVHVELVADSDSGADGGTDPARTAAAARRAVAEPSAIGIIGPLTSSGSKAMAPVTNRAHMPILGISATAVGLTRRADGAPGMPRDVAPTGKPNLVRLVPNDARQSLALAAYMKEESIGDLVILHDGQTYGAGLAAALQHDAPRAGIKVHAVNVMPTDRDAAPAARAAALSLSDTTRTPAVLIACNSYRAAVAAARAAARSNDRVLIFGPDSMALRGVYANLGTEVERRVYITSYLLPIQYYGPLGDAVFQRLSKRLGRSPTPTALYAYEAMSLLLGAIHEALPDEASLKSRTVTEQRAAVTAELLHTFDRGSVIGTYSIDVHGDTTNTLYGAYRVENKELVRGQAIDTGVVS